jgi:hypothetical protein
MILERIGQVLRAIIDMQQIQQNPFTTLLKRSIDLRDAKTPCCENSHFLTLRTQSPGASARWDRSLIRLRCHVGETRRLQF